MKITNRRLFLSTFATLLFLVALLYGLLPQSVFAAPRCSYGSQSTTVADPKNSPAFVDAWRNLPNLTGSWINQNAPTAPPWSIDQKGTSVTASWCCAPGHTTLHGNFTGTMNADGTKVTGTAHVTEGPVVAGTPSVVVDTPMAFTIINANKFILSYYNKYRHTWDTGTFVRQ